MAIPIITAAPQTFTFAGLNMLGVLTSFTGSDPRRHVVHQFIKRRGARVEDMREGPRTLEVTLQLLGGSNIGNPQRTASEQYAFLVNHINEHPVGLLVHPIAGKWQAFCHGPSHDVNFSRALNQISMRLAFTETELDAPPLDTPNTATAAQEVTTTESAFEVGVAEYLGVLAKAQIFVAETLAEIDEALETIALVEAPIDFMLGVITSAYGVTSSLIGKITRISTKSQILIETIASYSNQAARAGVFFLGTDAPVGGLQSMDTLLGNVQTDGQDLIDEMISTSPRNATCADGVADVEAAVAACIVLADALRASRPPTIIFVVPADIDLLTLCQIRYRANAQAHAADIQNMNRIPNPALIPSGTRLLIPSR